MLELLKSVIKSIGKAVYEDKEIKKLVDKYPRTFKFFNGRFSPGKEFGLYLTVGIILSAIFIFMFFSLIEDIIRRDPIVQADLRITNLLQLFRTPSFNKLMLFITYLGNWEVVFLGLALLCIIFAIAKKWKYIVALLVSVGVGEIFVWVVKHIIQRPRPLLVNALIQEDSFSFPSGHAFISLSFYGLLTYFLFKVSKTKLQKVLSFIGGLGVIIAIGFSRIYLGVHWPSDILASYVAGATWLVMIITALQIEEKFHLNQKNKERSLPKNEKSLIILSVLFLIIFLGFTIFFYQTHPLKISLASVNSTIILEKDIPNNLFNNLPRTSEDLTGNPIEPINIIIVANEKQLDNVFQKAGY